METRNSNVVSLSEKRQQRALGLKREYAPPSGENLREEGVGLFLDAADMALASIKDVQSLALFIGDEKGETTVITAGPVMWEDGLDDDDSGGDAY